MVEVEVLLVYTCKKDHFQISNEILLGIFCIQHNTNENTVKENDLLWTIKEKSWQTGPHNKA